MNKKIEKLGLVIYLFGLVASAALFIMGNGDPASVIVNGRPADYVFPAGCLVIGQLMFIFS